MSQKKLEQQEQPITFVALNDAGNDNNSFHPGSMYSWSSACDSDDNETVTIQSGSGANGQAPGQHPIARRENRRVAMSRLLMLAVLTAAASGTAYVTYWFTRRVEQNDFITRVSRQSDMVFARLQKNVTFDPGLTFEHGL